LNTSQPCLQVAAIVLAAGAGTRMGRLKQLLPYRTSTFIRHAIEQATEAGFAPLVVVLGAESAQVRASIAAFPVQIAENSDWHLGMGSSIACGMRTVQAVAADTPVVAILLADQPLVTADHLRSMRALLSPDYSAVAAEYGGGFGVPALFQRKLFSSLLSLAPEAGAKQFLQRLGGAVRPFPLPEAGIDIDTPEDYARLTS
jgi:molybdenum cofactor cytidylyltransferase